MTWYHISSYKSMQCLFGSTNCQAIYSVFVLIHADEMLMRKNILPHRWSTNSKWWRHQMETFSALLALCAGNSPVPVNSPHKGQWRGTFMFPLICTLDKRLSKQSWGRWFETLSRPLWRHWNEKQFCGTAPDTARLGMSTFTQNSEATILLPVNLLTPWYFIRILDKLF